MPLPPASPQPENQIESSQGAFFKVTALMLLVYGILAIFYRIPALIDPRFFYKEMLVWPVTLALLWGYWQGTRALAEPNAIPLRWVILSGLGLAILAVLVPPFHSTDMFGYMNRGWQQLHYQMNPYVHTVDAIPNWDKDPMITNHWVNNPSPYGFLYLLIAKGICLLGNGNRELTLGLFKFGNLLMHFLTAGLIWLGAKHLNENPNSPYPGKIRPDLALFLYLWNPLILINALSNGHNDIYMGFFVTLSALFAIVGAWLWILPALMAATLIKYGAAVILPIAVLFLIKQKAWSALGLGLIFSLALFLVTGIPFLPEWQQFHLSEINHNAFVSHGSLHSMIFTAFKTLTTKVFHGLYPYRSAVSQFLKNALLLTYTGFYIGLAWKRARQTLYTPTGFVRDALLVMGVLVCLISLKFYPWYLGMFFPLALFLPEKNDLRRWVIVLSGAQLFSITFIGQAHMLNYLVMTALPTGWIIWQQRKQSKLALTSQYSSNDHSVEISAPSPSP